MRDTARARRLRGAHDLLLPHLPDRRAGAEGPEAVAAAALTIERVGSVTDELVDALRRLIPQLSPKAAPVTREHLVELVADERTALFVARDAGSIVGTLTLATYRIPTGRAGWIEDVVVDESARGRGIGEALTEAAKHVAREWRLDAVALTSRPEREAANRLYRRLGFEQRETNVYRWRPGAP